MPVLFEAAPDPKAMPAMLKYRLICRAETREDKPPCGASAVAVAECGATTLLLLLQFLKQGKFSYTKVVGV